MEKQFERMASADDAQADRVLLEKIANFEKHVLEMTAGDPERKKLGGEIMTEIELFFGNHAAREHEGLERLRVLATTHSNMLVRREDPRMLFHALARHEPLAIRFAATAHRGEPYPNAAALGSDLSGLAIPYERGFAKVETGALQCIAGFVPDAATRVEHLQKLGYEHYTGQTRAQVRMVQGDVDPQNISFVIMRLPRTLFPEDRMTDTEREEEQVFYINRVFELDPVHIHAPHHAS